MNPAMIAAALRGRGAPTPGAPSPSGMSGPPPPGPSPQQVSPPAGPGGGLPPPMPAGPDPAGLSQVPQGMTPDQGKAALAQLGITVAAIPLILQAIAAVSKGMLAQMPPPSQSGLPPPGMM